ncbi:hypothetical protein HOY82DRAFT_539980 [Tuber indicum]|nr:hypothetical protein HOY82DRAFT_539980 [Tuber indicum]
MADKLNEKLDWGFKTNWTASDQPGSYQRLVCPPEIQNFSMARGVSLLDVVSLWNEAFLQVSRETRISSQFSTLGSFRKHVETQFPKYGQCAAASGIPIEEIFTYTVVCLITSPLNGNTNPRVYTPSYRLPATGEHSCLQSSRYGGKNPGFSGGKNDEPNCKVDSFDTVSARPHKPIKCTYLLKFLDGCRLIRVWCDKRRLSTMWHGEMQQWLRKSAAKSTSDRL